MVERKETQTPTRSLPLEREVWLLLPAKDEGENIGALVREARALGYQVVVCDDGSLDHTASAAQSAGATVVRHERNLGLAAAIRTLLDHFLAKGGPGDWAVLMDADGTMSPEDGLRLVAKGEATGADLVIGSRYRGRAEGIPLHRQIFSYGARFLFSLFFPIRGVTDYTIGFRAYRYEFLRQYVLRYPGYFSGEGFSASTELLLRARSLKPKVVEEGIHLDYARKGGGSKMRIWRTVREYLLLMYRLRGEL